MHTQSHRTCTLLYTFEVLGNGGTPPRTSPCGHSCQRHMGTTPKAETGYGHAPGARGKESLWAGVSPCDLSGLGTPGTLGKDIQKLRLAASRGRGHPEGALLFPLLALLWDLGPFPGCRHRLWLGSGPGHSAPRHGAGFNLLGLEPQRPGLRP